MTLIGCTRAGETCGHNRVRIPVGDHLCVGFERLPDVAVVGVGMSHQPGMMLRLALEAADCSQAELSRRTGLTTKHVNLMVQGIARISAEVAVRIEEVLPTISAKDLLIVQMQKDLAEARSRR